MVQVKEFKGSIKNPNVEEDVNAFFQEIAKQAEDNAEVQILDIKYSTVLITFAVQSEGKTTTQYAPVSSVLIFYNI